MASDDADDDGHDQMTVMLLSDGYDAMVSMFRMIATMTIKMAVTMMMTTTMPKMISNTMMMLMMAGMTR